MSEAQARRDFALEVVLRLRRAGFQALWAGGCVRDLILGLDPTDYDVATDATPEQVMLTLPFRAITVGISFGVVRVRQPRTPGIEVEVATFRSDFAYVDGRRPSSVVFSSPELDASRRDFTINGLFMDPESNQVIDYVGGLSDLRHKVLRPIGTAWKPPLPWKSDIAGDIGFWTVLLVRRAEGRCSRRDRSHAGRYSTFVCVVSISTQG